MFTAVVSPAPTQCISSDQLIARGEPCVRIGNVAYEKSRHFLTRCRVAAGPTALCPSSQERIAADEPRVIVELPDGQVQLSLNSVAATLRDLYNELRLDATYLPGMHELTAGQRRTAFKGLGVSSAQAGNFMKRGKDAPVKKKAAKSASVGKKRVSADLPEGAPAVAPSQRAAKRGRGSASASAASGDGRRSAKAAPPPPPAALSHLSEYELKRQAQLKRNAERMRELALPALASGLLEHQAAAQKPADRDPSLKRMRAPPAPTVPMRTSLRSRPLDQEESAALMRAEGEGRGRRGSPGSSVSPNGARKRRTSTSSRAADSHSRTQPTADAKMVSLNGNDESDAAYIEALAKCQPCTSAGQLDEAEPLQPSALTLREENVAKVVKEGLVCVEFMPSDTMCVVAAGDKRGHVGLWIVDLMHSGASTNLGEDGVQLFKPHAQYVSGLQWMNSGTAPASLLTSSYDGSVVLMDVEAEQFRLVAVHADDEFSAMGVQGPELALLGDAQGNVTRVDLRQKAFAEVPVNVHVRKINTIHFKQEEGATEFVTSCSDGSVSIWDIRRFGPKAKSVADLSHAKSCHGAFWAPDGSARILSTSYDDTVRLWQGDQQWEQAGMAKHDNQTGRWTSPFRAIWTPSADGMLMGDMKRSLAVCDSITSSWDFSLLSSEFMTAIPSRMCCHHSLPVVAAGTGSGRVHIWTNQL